MPWGLWIPTKALVADVIDRANAGQAHRRPDKAACPDHREFDATCRSTTAACELLLGSCGVVGRGALHHLCLMVLDWMSGLHAFHIGHGIAGAHANLICGGDNGGGVSSGTLAVVGHNCKTSPPQSIATADGLA